MNTPILSLSQGRADVRRAARENKELKFTTLLHHLTVDLLRENFYSLKRKAAPGRTMRPTWRIDQSIFTAEFIVKRIERCPREECTSRKKMDGNVRWELRLWCDRYAPLRANDSYH